MNNLIRTLLTGLLALGTLGVSLHAQAPNADQEGSWQNLLMVLEVYALDKKDALAVLETERSGAARYRRVMELSKAGQARFETLTAITAKSGQRVDTESVDEVRYPTEFHSPTLKNSIAAPTAWETRNVGDSLEIEAAINDEKPAFDATIAPKRVSLKGFRDVGGMADDELVSQPLFVAQKITTSVSMRENEPYYLGTMTPPTAHGIANGQADSEVWLAFLHGYLPGPTANEVKPPAKSAANSSLNLEYTFYSMDRTQARDLLVGSSTLDAPWERLQVLLNAKKATVEHLSTINTVSGQRAVAEEIQEMRFATEYSPESARPASTEMTTRTIKSRPKAADEATEATTDEQVTTTRSDANGERQPGGATAFETRNVGVTIEVEPVIGPDTVTIDLNQNIQSVTHVGNLQVTGIAKRYPAELLFETRKVTNTQILLLGRHMLVGTFNPPGANGVNERQDTGRTWLLFVRAMNEP